MNARARRARAGTQAKQGKRSAGAERSKDFFSISLVKLGENASPTLAELEPAASSQGIFSNLLMLSAVRSALPAPSLHVSVKVIWRSILPV